MSEAERCDVSSIFHFVGVLSAQSLTTRDRPIYIGLPIFKHFTIIGFEKRFFLFVTYTIIQSITSSEMCSLYLTHPRAHTLGAVDTHTDTHTHTHTHTWSSGHCSLRRCSSTTTACNFIQDSLVETH